MMDQADMDFIREIVYSLEKQMDRRFAESRAETNERFDRLEAGMERFGARLDKIAAGAHYVTRLVEWSEKQDLFQAAILRRINDLSDRVKRLEGGE